MSEEIRLTANQDKWLDEAWDKIEDEPQEESGPQTADPDTLFLAALEVAGSDAADEDKKKAMDRLLGGAKAEKADE